MHAGEEGAFRLVGGEVSADVGYGVPQIFHAGAWGTFCNGDDDRYDYFEGTQYLGLSTFTDARIPFPNMHASVMITSCIMVGASGRVSSDALRYHTDSELLVLLCSNGAGAVLH